MTIYQLKVSGMTCGHCAKAISSELTKLPQIDDLVIDYAAGTVELEAESAPNRADVEKAIANAGYQLSEWLD